MVMPPELLKAAFPVAGLKLFAIRPISDTRSILIVPVLLFLKCAVIPDTMLADIDLIGDHNAAVIVKSTGSIINSGIDPAADINGPADGVIEYLLIDDPMGFPEKSGRPDFDTSAVCNSTRLINRGGEVSRRSMGCITADRQTTRRLDREGWLRIARARKSYRRGSA